MLPLRHLQWQQLLPSCGFCLYWFRLHRLLTLMLTAMWYLYALLLPRCFLLLQETWFEFATQNGLLCLSWKCSLTKLSKNFFPMFFPMPGFAGSSRTFDWYSLRRAENIYSCMLVQHFQEFPSKRALPKIKQYIVLNQVHQLFFPTPGKTGYFCHFFVRESRLHNWRNCLVAKLRSIPLPNRYQYLLR